MITNSSIQNGFFVLRSCSMLSGGREHGNTIVDIVPLIDSAHAAAERDPGSRGMQGQKQRLRSSPARQEIKNTDTLNTIDKDFTRNVINTFLLNVSLVWTLGEA